MSNQAIIFSVFGLYCAFMLGFILIAPSKYFAFTRWFMADLISQGFDKGYTPGIFFKLFLRNLPGMAICLYLMTLSFWTTVLAYFAMTMFVYVVVRVVFGREWLNKALEA